MGKNSLIKSTSKKKTTVAKKDEEKKATPAKKTATVKKTATKSGRVTKAKTGAKPRTTAKIKESVTAKTTPRTRTKKAAVPKKKMVSMKDLILKKFDTWKPEKVFSVDPDEKYQKNFAAPPVVPDANSDVNPEEVKRIKQLLLKKFDLTALPDYTPPEEDTVKKEALIPEEPVSCQPPCEPPDAIKGSDPTAKAMKYFLAGFVLLIVLIISASISNMSKYYIKPADGAVEIWQGKFAPMGECLFITLPGAQPPETVKAIYSKKEALSLAFSYYIDKADILLDISGMPDFNGIKSYLNKALALAATDSHRNAAYTRLNSIDLMILMYKADVAASKETISSLESAEAYLEEAASLDLDDAGARLVKEKIESIRNSLAVLEAKQAKSAAKTAPAE